MIRQVKLLLCALQLMTRLPLPKVAGFEPDWVARAAPYYPVAGWVVGGLSALALLAASRLWPGAPSAVIALVVGWIVTGGFHEDGLADLADGLGGGRTPARRLEIMKDSRIGSYGALALVSVLALKAAALAATPPLAAALALVASHGAARAATAGVMAALPYVGDPETSKLKLSATAVRLWEALVAATLGLAPLVLVASAAHALLALALGGAASIAVALLARRLLGGYTGDVLGGVEQAAEAALLLGLSASLP